MINLDLILNFDLNYDARRAEMDRLMQERGFSFLGEGRHRAAYVNARRTYVIKFPVSEGGLKANRFEAERYALHKLTPEPDYGIVYAPCRLLQKALLLMLFAPILFGDTRADEDARRTGLVGLRDYYAMRDKHNLPKWIGRLDSRQAGILRSGRIVAYDYTTAY